MRLAIASGKGGTGKTTLAVNLALKASGTMKTVLADLDVEEPNGSIFIGGETVDEKQVYRYTPAWDQKSCSLCGKCTSWCAYNALIKLGEIILVMPNLCHSCYACSELCPDGALPMEASPLGTIRHFSRGKLDFTESKLNIGLEQAAPLIKHSLNYLDENFKDYDLQILDSPPGTACSMMEAVRSADYVILVTEPTPFGLHDLKLAVETVRQLELPFAVVINRDGIGNDELDRYLKAEEIAVWARIPHQREIAELYSRGEILFDKVAAVDDALTEILQRLEGLS